MNNDIFSLIESAVRDVFEKHYLGRLMLYSETRELVWLEKEIVDNVISEIRLNRQGAGSDGSVGAPYR